MSFPTEAILAMAGNPASVSCDFLLSSRDSQLAQICRIKNKQGPFPGRTPVMGVITPSTIS